MLASSLYQLILAVLLSSTFSYAKSKAKDAVRLSQVKTLTLRHDQLTSGRRLDPIPQLTCIDGSAKGLYNVDVMQCKNSGAEYNAEDISWTCTASLPPEFKLGSTDVICEGYDSPDDPFILKGSCGVEYRLALTELGEEKYGNYKWKRPKTNSYSAAPSEPSEGTEWATYIFWIIFLFVLAFMVYKFFNPEQPAGNRPPRRNNNFYGGGGGGGGDDNDPPPPYTPQPPPSKKSNSSWSAPRASSSRQSSNNSWRPGPWTAGAAGAAAGYALGSRNSNNRTDRNAAAQAGPSNWFGNVQATVAPRGGSTNTNSGGGSGWTGGGSMPSPSAERQSSTGFGGTRRR